MPTKTAVTTLALDDESHDLLAARLAGKFYPANSFNEYIEEIREVSHNIAPLFSRIADFLNFNVQPSDRPGAVKITNLPVSATIPPPPTDGTQQVRISKPDYLSENLLTAIGLLFGEPYSMHCEGKGLINNLIPSQATSTQITGLGANSDLRFHAENAALRFLTGHDCAPAALLLLGVKQEPNPPKTRLSDARLALDLLDTKDLALLKEPQYHVKLPYRWRSFRAEYEETCTRAIPLVEEDADGIIVHAAFYGDMISAISTPEAERAARAFEGALEAVAVDEVASPGEMLLIDNRTTLHARTPFKASFDAEGRAMRWVQRLFVTKDLRAFDEWEQTNDRVYAPVFTAARQAAE